jgi:hypothetical protein
LPEQIKVVGGHVQKHIAAGQGNPTKFTGIRAQVPLLFAAGRAFFWGMKKCVILFLASAWSVFAAGPAVGLSVLENGVLYVRADSVTADFSAEVHAAWPTNKISSVVLDLRFADGDNPADAASYFVHNPMPLVLLVNRQTRGAAAALAVQLRTARAGIVISGTNPPAVVTPDITVAVGADDEKEFQANPFGLRGTGKTGFQTNSLSESNHLLPYIDHMSEAELVRKQIKDGEEDGSAVPSPHGEPASPVIRDPELARAVDLLKALAVLGKARG